MKIFKIILFCIVTIFIINSCRIPTPVFHKDYKSNLSDYSYYFIGDTMWMQGGHHTKVKYKYKEWSFWNGLHSHYISKNKPNKYSYFTTNRKLIAKTLKDNLYPSIYMESDKVVKQTKKTINPILNRLPQYYINYKNKVFLIGGNDYNQNKYGDVWSVTNGGEWINILEEGPWASGGYRCNHKLIVYNNKIVLFGGYNAVDHKSDVWTSTDGINWKLSGNIDKMGRIDEIIVYNGKVYMLGLNKKHNKKIFISSSDIKNWEELNYFSDSKYVGYKLFEWNGDLYSSVSSGIWKYADNQWIEQFNSHIFNGEIYIANDTLFNLLINGEILFSTDAVNWRFKDNYNKINLNPDYDFNPKHYSYKGKKIVKFKDTLWVLSGTTGLEYFSADGINWKISKKANNIYIPRTNFGTIVFDDKLWVIGGVHWKEIDSDKDYYDVIELKDTWYTTDGINWIEAQNNFVHNCSGFKSIVNDNKLYIIGGSHFQDYPEIWVTQDGSDWQHIMDFDTIPNGHEIRSSFLNAIVVDSKIRIFDAYLGSGYSTLNFNGTSNFTNFVKNTNHRRTYKRPDNMDNIVSIKNSTNKTQFIAKDDETLFTSGNLTEWDSLYYETDNITSTFDLQYSTLVEFKNELFLIDFNDTLINSMKINMLSESQ